MGLNEKIPSLDPNQFGPNRRIRLAPNENAPFMGRYVRRGLLTLRRVFDSFTNESV